MGKEHWYKRIHWGRVAGGIGFMATGMALSVGIGARYLNSAETSAHNIAAATATGATSDQIESENHNLKVDLAGIAIAEAIGGTALAGGIILLRNAED